MRGAVLAVALGIGGALAFVAPASAAQIGIKNAANGPVPVDGDRAVHMVAAPGERNDVVVQAEGGDALSGWPLTVTVTDQGATFDAAPPTGDAACEIVDAHTARCTAAADTQFTQAVMDLGDEDNHLRFGPGSQPLREQFLTGDGNDVIETGPFVGDASYRWNSGTGGGDDIVHIATPVRDAFGAGPLWTVPPEGLAVNTGPGADKIVAANGAFDEVNCGADADVLIADPWDIDTVYIEDPGSCETRALPGVE